MNTVNLLDDIRYFEEKMSHQKTEIGKQRYRTAIACIENLMEENTNDLAWYVPAGVAKQSSVSGAQPGYLGIDPELRFLSKRYIAENILGLTGMDKLLVEERKEEVKPRKLTATWTLNTAEEIGTAINAPKTEEFICTFGEGSTGKGSQVTELPKGVYETAKLGSDEIVRRLDIWVAELNYERAMKVVKP